MNNFDWSKYEIKQRSEPTSNMNDQQVSNEPSEDEKIDWNKYRPKEEMGYLGEVGRGLARTGSRIGETLLGFPGETVQLVNWLQSKLPELPQFLKKEPSFLEKKGKEFLLSLPTSSELKDKMSEITNGFTDPQGALEEFGDDILGLATALTVGKDPTKISNLLGSIGKSFLAKGAKKSAEKLGGGEKTQLAAELGTLFLTGLTNQKMAEKFIGEKYTKAKSLIPSGTMLPTQNLERELTHLESDLSKGLSTSSKNEVKNAVAELRSKVSGGSYPAEELVDAFHDINERMSSKKLFDELSQTERKKLKFRYDAFKDEVSKEIKNYGNYNPEFLKEWQSANEGYATIQNSKKVSKFLEAHIGKLPGKVAGGIAVELFLGHPEVAVGTAGTFAGLKTGELLYRIGKSSALQKHYLDVVKSATEENLPAMINSLNKLDKGLKESFIGGVNPTREETSRE